MPNIAYLLAGFKYFSLTEELYILLKIEKKLRLWRNHVSIAEVQVLPEILRRNVFNDIYTI